MLDEKLVAVSFQAIADVCNCTADFVQNLFQVIRDEIVETVTAKKQTVSLNFLIGSLNITQNQ